MEPFRQQKLRKVSAGKGKETTMIKRILLNNQWIEYELIRKNVKNINLHVKSDLTISVSANPRVKKEYIEKFLVSKAEWIEKSLHKFENRENVQNQENRFLNGETIRLLGKEYEIQILPSAVDKIELCDSKIYCSIKNPEDLDKIERLWNKRLDLFIKEVFYEVVERMLPKYSDYNMNMPIIKLRYMKTRWGTCTVNSGTITLNKILIQMPKECIEYVAAHELAHFVYPNHSNSFYRVLEGAMPDYKEREKLLIKYNTYC